ncbi:hypothetical protein LNQ03_08325 [Klebsiella pneumoniae subsp. pneumoniae]|nr:hypothetical protein [Klebsiella pneumoniae subsp. pneumoniae]
MKEWQWLSAVEITLLYGCSRATRWSPKDVDCGEHAVGETWQCRYESRADHLCGT